MGTNYDQDPKNVSKCQQCLNYASCDKIIKNSPCNVGLKCLKADMADRHCGWYSQLMVNSHNSEMLMEVGKSLSDGLSE